METGFRASSAALGDWSKSIDGLELRAKSLTDQIDIQRAKVTALQGEYERVAAEKGANSRAAQHLQIRLNRETEALKKTRPNWTDRGALAEMRAESDKAAMKCRTWQTV